METTPKYVFLGLLVVVVGALAALGIHHRGNLPREPDLHGAGSTFVAPLMTQWCGRYEKLEDGCRIGYRGVGSSAGLKMTAEKRVDFSCSEAHLSNEQLAKAKQNGQNLIHIPLVLGAIVPVYNLPDVKLPVRFDGETLAAMYLGSIKKWNDPALVKLNPELTLPDREILVTHRSDGSGTTHVFSDYLSKASPDWKAKFGAGTEFQWPVGKGEAGNEGVAKRVHATPGSIGYVELVYAFRFDLSAGLMKNRENQFVKANLQSIAAASDNAATTASGDLRVSLTDAAGNGSFPIVGITWAIADTNQDKKKGRRLAQFLTWALDDGQNDVEALFYARLPAHLAENARQKLKLIAEAQ